MNGYKYKIFFTVATMILLPFFTRADVMSSSVDVSADTGGNAAASNTTVVTGTANTSVNIETVSSDQQHTSTVYIKTGINGHTYSQTYTAPGNIHVSLIASSTGHTVQIHYATSTSRTVPSTRTFIAHTSLKEATSTPSNNTSSFLQQIVARWFSSLFRFLGW